MNILNAIVWDAEPDIFEIGPLTVRWYGLLFAMGFIIGQQVLIRIFRVEGKPESDVETLTVYMVLSTIIGARLGHCLFYQPDIYLADPIKILYIHEGGLASHGAAIGILFALWLYARKRKDQSYLWILDRIVITVALGGAFIRFGNLMNSEIIGKPADVVTSFFFVNPATSLVEENFNQAVEEVDFTQLDQDTLVDGITYNALQVKFIFSDNSLDETAKTRLVTQVLNEYPRRYSTAEHIKVFNPSPKIDFALERGKQTASFTVYGIPRHPAQLYESMSCLLLFFLLLILYYRYKRQLPEGRIFGIFLLWIFGLRFFYEFLKENQVAFEDNLALNMGQWLSIPLVIVGIFILLYSFGSKVKERALLRSEAK